LGKGGICSYPDCEGKIFVGRRDVDFYEPLFRVVPEKRIVDYRNQEHGTIPPKKRKRRRRRSSGGNNPRMTKKRGKSNRNNSSRPPISSQITEVDYSEVIGIRIHFTDAPPVDSVYTSEAQVPNRNRYYEERQKQLGQRRSGVDSILDMEVSNGLLEFLEEMEQKGREGKESSGPGFTHFAVDNPNNAN